MLERIGDIMNEKMGNVVIYKTEDGKDKIEEKIENNTVWLTKNSYVNYFMFLNQQWAFI